MFKFEVENGRKYYMASRYEFYPDVDGNRVDYVHIGVATEKDFENDGFNYVDRRESVDFEICDTIKDAILRSGKIADRVEFVDLPEEDMEEAKKVVDELMHDAEYLKKFGLRLEGLVVSVYNQKNKRSSRVYHER